MWNQLDERFVRNLFPRQTFVDLVVDKIIEGKPATPSQAQISNQRPTNLSIGH